MRTPLLPPNPNWFESCFIGTVSNSAKSQLWIKAELASSCSIRLWGWSAELRLCFRKRHLLAVVGLDLKIGSIKCDFQSCEAEILHFRTYFSRHVWDGQPSWLSWFELFIASGEWHIWKIFVCASSWQSLAVSLQTDHQKISCFEDVNIFQ